MHDGLIQRILDRNNQMDNDNCVAFSINSSDYDKKTAIKAR
jgi:hypothetical protein